MKVKGKNEWSTIILVYITAFFIQYRAFWPPSADFENVLKFMEKETSTLAKNIREMFRKRKKRRKKDHYNPDQVPIEIRPSNIFHLFSPAILPPLPHSRTEFVWEDFHLPWPQICGEPGADMSSPQRCCHTN